MNENHNVEPVQVRVNQRALVEKVLARYPEEFTVFRELVQNADDAGAEHVEIEFQTEEYSREPSSENSTNGFTLDSIDVNKMKIFKWVVKNDGAVFTTMDWDRLTNIADGNPDDQKIGAFGVGFYSVFSITERPVVISGGHRKRLFFDGDQLMVQSGCCEYTKDTIIEMEVKEEQLRVPKPFDLSRFLCTTVTFLTKVEKVTVLFNGHALSEIQRNRSVSEKIKALPKGMKRKKDSGMMTVDSVEMFRQEIRVTLTKAAYAAGTRKLLVNKAGTEKDGVNPINKADFFANQPIEPNGHASISRTLSAPDTTTSVVEYTIYSASVSSTPTKEVACGLEAATKKKPPRNFLCEVLYFDMDQHQRVMQDGNEEGGLGSVFRGAQALWGEEYDGHGSRLFIGQSTAQTSGIATHLSSRFIPTVERGSIDLANDHVATWNKEVLYAGGFLARLIYERAMKNIRDRWPELPGTLRARLRMEALHVMECFTFRPSTPEPKVEQLLRSAFFECSTSQSFPILSNLGIRDSRDVRIPHKEFKPFMKDRPVVDDALSQINPTIVNQLQPYKDYRVRDYTLGDVHAELDGRVLAEEEMIACLHWWVKSFLELLKTTEGIPDADLRSHWKKVASVAKFRSQISPRVINLSAINKFVVNSLFPFLRDSDPLPPYTIPIPFTEGLDADQVRTALGWEHLTLVDWIYFLVSPGLDATQDICKNAAFSEKVLDTLQKSWASIEPTDKANIIALMQTVPCITTNRGPRKPQEAYFPEVDLFNELPVAKFLPQEYIHSETVLDSLGVQRYLPWDSVMDRLLSGSECSMMRLVTYLDAVRLYMKEDDFKIVKQLAIFSCESEEKRRCIGELYRPDALNRALGLPTLVWHDAYTDIPIFHELGLHQHPPLDAIIRKACSEDPVVRKSAWDFFVKRFDDLYDKYDPNDFRDAPFIPCTSRGKPHFSTPEEVLTSSNWEIFGFYTIDKSVAFKTRTKLKLKERPSEDAIIKAMQTQSPPDRSKATKWFNLLASEGGFSTNNIGIISEMEIVPLAPTGANPATTTAPALPGVTSPSKCFYERPDHTKIHHGVIFTYVDFGKVANGFLKLCGAKANPDCSDIVNAMINNPQEYLNKIDTFIQQHNQTNTQTYKIYLDDLRQVAAGYHSLPPDLRTRMKTAPIFMSFRKISRATDGLPSTDLKEYALKPAHEILIADDLESHRLFGEYIYVAPKEEVFENFYRDYGSESLSAHVKHQVNQTGFVAEAEELRYHVFDRLKIFLHDQDSTRRSDFRVSRWKNVGAFTVKYCRLLGISKTLEFDYVTEPDSKPLRAIQEPALAGIEHTEERDTLWVKQQPEGSRRDWYDVAVALCRIIFSMHKTHDTLLLMTILDSNLDDLRRRGYDVDQIRDAYDEEAQRADQLQGAIDRRKNQLIIPFHPLYFLRNWFKDLTNSRKRKDFSEEFVCSNMESMVTEALEMCESDADMKRSFHADRSKPKGEKKRTDVRYCGSRHLVLDRCKIVTRKGMLVFKTDGSEDPPESELEAFSGILDELGKLFGLGSEKLHVFWYQEDREMMGFNRNRAIYLNLAHFKEKHTDWTSNATARASMYTAWYFIIAHEIAHNKVFFHDEDHELLFSSIAQHCLPGFKKLLDKRAPGAE